MSKIKIMTTSKDKKLLSPRENRLNCKLDIKHDVVIPDIHYDGTISNLSSGGVYFESNELILPRDEISITVKKLNDEEITFDVCIIWKKDLPDSAYRYGYGAKSISPNKFMVQACDLDNKQIAESEDKREYQRTIFNKQIRLKNSNKIYKGQIRDISRGGAFIETDSIFSIGKKIVLTLSGKLDKKSVRLTGWIVRKGYDGFGISFNRRSGTERRYDIDRRIGLDRRNRRQRPTE